MTILSEFITNINGTASFTEAVLSGYSAIFEGFDLGSYSQDERTAFDKKQEFAASVNPAMNTILRSQRALAGKYVEDEESELDKNGTSIYSIPKDKYDQWVKSGNMEGDPLDRLTGDPIEDSLGTTATDMFYKNGNKAVPEDQDSNDRFDLSTFGADF